MPSTNRQLRIATILGACLAITASASPALAHTGHGSSGLLTGFTHPMLGIDHVFAMVTVGLLAAVLARPIAMPAMFLGAMVVGGTLGIAGLPLPGGEAAIAISVAALGAALVFGRAVRPDLAFASLALAGFVHGHAHGVEAPSVAHPVIYVAGFVAATAMLHIAGVGVGLRIRNSAAARGVLGAVVMGAGLGLVAGLI